MRDKLTATAHRCDVGYRHSDSLAMEGREMDWKCLIRFVLLGSGALEQYAILRSFELK